MEHSDPQADQHPDDPYVYRQPAGYAAGLGAPAPPVPGGPRLAAIPELPPQEYGWNYRVRGGGIYDQPAAPDPTAPGLVDQVSSVHPTTPPGASQVFVNPGAARSGRAAVAVAWVLGVVALVEAGVIAGLVADWW